MKNAHERFGWLEFEKQLKDTRTRLRVALDGFVAKFWEDATQVSTSQLSYAGIWIRQTGRTARR